LFQLIKRRVDLCILTNSSVVSLEITESSVDLFQLIKSRVGLFQLTKSSFCLFQLTKSSDEVCLKRSYPVLQLNLLSYSFVFQAIIEDAEEGDASVDGSAD